MKYLYSAVLILFFTVPASATDWQSYDRYLTHGWQHDKHHVVPHRLPHMHSNPHPDALAYPTYQERRLQRSSPSLLPDGFIMPYGSVYSR